MRCRHSATATWQRGQTRLAQLSLAPVDRPPMPRPIRHNVPGTVYHLISRFVDREWFVETPEERATYLRLLARAIQISDWLCLAYAVMSNHIHLAMLAGEQPLGPIIRQVHSPFADWMNRRHDRIGSMFVRGPKDYRVPPARI